MSSFNSKPIQSDECKFAFVVDNGVFDAFFPWMTENNVNQTNLAAKLDLIMKD
jgi:hypothetical protein